MVSLNTRTLDSPPIATDPDPHLMRGAEEHKISTDPLGLTTPSQNERGIVRRSRGKPHGVHYFVAHTHCRKREEFGL
jgi:hypothetical protein